MLRKKLITDKQKLIYDLGEMWSTNVKWTLPKDGERQDNCTLSLSTNDKDIRTKIGSTIKAMHQLDILQPKLKIFGDRFLRFVVRPVVETPGVSVNASVGKTAELQIKQGKGETDNDLTAIFGSIYVAVDFLHKHLFSLKLDQMTLMQHLSELIWEDFADFVISTCLANSVPTSKKELDEYTQARIFFWF